MSIWGENPEWFDQWLERQAEDGRFDDDTKYGPEVRQLVAAGDFLGYQWWDRLDATGKLDAEAMTAFIESFVK